MALAAARRHAVDRLHLARRHAFGYSSAGGESMSDNINHPPHYTQSKVECIEAIEAAGYGLHFCLGNAMKYIWRCQHKANFLEDLKKARWYLDRAIKQVEEDNDSKTKDQ